MGIDTTRTKAQVFVLSALISALQAVFSPTSKASSVPIPSASSSRSSS